MMQAHTVARFLKTAGLKADVEAIDEGESGGEGFFVKELEQALLDRRIDLAVHRMKDVPGMIAKGLAIAAVTKREDPRDVLISTVSRGISDLPAGSRVAALSPRRRIQIQAERDDLTFVSLSGTVDDRLGKLKEGEAEALVMAAAGLKRLRIEKVVSQYLSLDRFVPAPGQGALAVEVRHEEGTLPGIVQGVCHHVPTALAVRAERNFLRCAGDDPQTPLGAYATLEGAGLTLRGFLATPEGTKVLNETITGRAEDAADLGKRLADELIAKLEGRSIGRRV